ncbi:MAG: mucoidy inhibitor MuiA family protein [Chloroflexi bacterium]|nr:mucoidy inhibitor MuiA family protein [Chloroflexota bacterium]
MNLPTQITSVAVYQQSARIERSGMADVSAGLNDLLVSDLPSTLDPSSVRARVLSQGGVSLMGLDVRTSYYQVPVQEQIRDLTQQLEALTARKRALTLELELLANQKSYLLSALETGAQQLPRGIAFGKREGEAMQSFLVASSEKIAQIDAQLPEREQALRNLELEISHVERQLAETGRQPATTGYSVLVSIDAREAAQAEVRLSYRVANASWSPLYDIRLSGDAAPQMTLTYLAEVSQNSGEAWDNVSLTLSTMREHSLSEVPEMDPWYLTPIEAIARRAPALMMARASEPMPEESAQVWNKEEVQVAEVITSGPAIAYQATQAVSIPPDGTPHKTTIAVISLEPAVDYVAAPKLDQAAYRRAKVTNRSPYHLLEGEANLFWGDEFLGQVHLEAVAPEAKFELSLGVDERIAVERKRTLHEVDKVLLRDLRKVTTGYTTTLTNHTSAPQQLVLRDHIPVANSEKVSVQLESSSPAAKPDDMGLLEWQLELPPQVPVEVTFQFSIQHPRGVRLHGMPELD